MLFLFKSKNQKRDPSALRPQDDGKANLQKFWNTLQYNIDKDIAGAYVIARRGLRYKKTTKELQRTFK
jgi:hypothetical protein